MLAFHPEKFATLRLRIFSGEKDSYLFVSCSGRTSIVYLAHDSGFMTRTPVSEVIEELKTLDENKVEILLWEKLTYPKIYIDNCTDFVNIKASKGETPGTERK